MPGHVKLGATGEPDPDPLPYLVVSMEMKRADMAKPYDAKKSIWVPTEDHGFVEALLESESGGKTIALVGHEVRYLTSVCYFNSLSLATQYTVHTRVSVDPCIVRIELLKSKYGSKFQIFEKQYFIS